MLSTICSLPLTEVWLNLILSGAIDWGFAFDTSFTERPDSSEDSAADPIVPAKSPLLGLLIAGSLAEGLAHIAVKLKDLDAKILQSLYGFAIRRSVHDDNGRFQGFGHRV